MPFLEKKDDAFELKVLKFSVKISILTCFFKMENYLLSEHLMSPSIDLFLRQPALSADLEERFCRNYIANLKNFSADHNCSRYVNDL